MGSKKHSHKYIKNKIESVEGYKLLSKTYNGNKKKLKVKCGKEHNYEVSWNNFNSGWRCPHCAGVVRHTHKYIKSKIESVEGYKLVSNYYKNSNTKMKIQCDKGHIYHASWRRFRSGRRCIYCSAINSVGEKEVLSLVESLTNKEVIPNDRTQIINPKTGRSLELDIWIPKLKKAIEYNGYYWHSLPYQQSKDKIKEQQCVKKDIELLVIKEMDWKNNKERCVNNIKYFVKNEV